jgi:hypothetical protein
MSAATWFITIAAGLLALFATIYALYVHKVLSKRSHEPGASEGKQFHEPGASEGKQFHEPGAFGRRSSIEDYLKKDYYKVLGVDQDADADEIKKSFMRLAKQYHPDVNRDDPGGERFKEISEAYRVLSNDERRQEYDAVRSPLGRFRTPWAWPPPPGRPTGTSAQAPGSTSPRMDWTPSPPRRPAPSAGGQMRGSTDHRSYRRWPLPRPRPRRTSDPGARPPGSTGGGTGTDVTGLPPVERYLRGTFPDTVRPGQIFSLVVSVVRSGGNAPLKPFDVPASGRRLTFIIDAPGLRVLDDQRQTVLVPADRDSEPVKFDLVGGNPGPRRVSVTAWTGGSYLGKLAVEVSVERDGPTRSDSTATSEIRQEPTAGEVTLLMRYDPQQLAYRFEFIDEDYPDGVTSELVYDPGPAVEGLVRRLNKLAEGTAGYSPEATRAYLANEGVQLWQQLVPEKLRSQFWERQERITQLTILTNRDVVPWELLYPKDRGKDAGFLVEQFPVTRAFYGCAQPRRLRLRPAHFVVPTGSPDDAKAEAKVLARLLGTELSTVSKLMPLVDLIENGNFGLLHFACHGLFDPKEGPSIKLDSAFTPTFLTIAASDQALAKTTPVVFINACRSLGQAPSYNKLDGWAEKFVRAGAAAFIGSLWEVTDGMAREFAEELYLRLLDGDPLGKAVMTARHAVAAEPGDPTWLAYAVYGHPQAKLDLAAT